MCHITPCKSGAVSPPPYHRGMPVCRPARGAEEDTLRGGACCLVLSDLVLPDVVCYGLVWYISPVRLPHCARHIAALSSIVEIRHLHQFPCLSISLCPLYCTRTYRRQLHAYLLIRLIHDLNITAWRHIPLRLLEEI